MGFDVFFCIYPLKKEKEKEKIIYKKTHLEYCYVYIAFYFSFILEFIHFVESYQFCTKKIIVNSKYQKKRKKEKKLVCKYFS